VSSVHFLHLRGGGVCACGARTFGATPARFTRDDDKVTCGACNTALVTPYWVNPSMGALSGHGIAEFNAELVAFEAKRSKPAVPPPAPTCAPRLSLVRPSHETLLPTTPSLFGDGA
jgi:hypothetical protein